MTFNLRPSLLRIGRVMGKALAMSISTVRTNTTKAVMDGNEIPLLISVVGTTGSGKSDLAIHLAQQLNGEIINSDALQVYNSLDVITNKVPPHERKVPHHLMDFRSVDDAHAHYSVLEFVRDATELIVEIQGRGKVPIVVGGTHYYLQYLLWGDEQATASPRSEEPDLPPDIAQLTDPQALYAKLRELDPGAAARWHPNDVRRVRNALVRHFRQLRAGEGGPTTKGPNPLRCRPLIFWPHAESASLDARLDARVDKMVSDGLFREVRQLRSLVESKPDTFTADVTTRGVFQAIGYKELAPYFDATDAACKEFGVKVDPADTSNEDDPVLGALQKEAKGRLAMEASMKGLGDIRESCLEAMKTATRQYARKQITWIRNKLAPRIRSEAEADAQNAAIYLLDTTDAALPSFTANALEPAVKIARAFIGKTDLPDPSEIHPKATEIFARADDRQGHHIWKKYTCDLCLRTLNGSHEWEVHQSSSQHRKAVRSARKAGLKDGRHVKRPKTVDD